MFEKLSQSLSQYLAGLRRSIIAFAGVTWGLMTYGNIRHRGGHASRDS